MLGYDDALDTFSLHGVGDTLGAVLTGFLAMHAANPNLATNLKDVVGQSLWLHQLAAIGVTLVLAMAGTAIIALVLKLLVGLRPTPEEETIGLDLTYHGAQGYIFE